jgi:hypothetical protein
MSKSIITVVAVVLLVNATQAQTKVKEAEVPKAVVESFNQNFKGAKVEKWEKEKNGEFEAEFTLNKVEQSANFSTDGKLLQTETEMKVSELPKSISDYFAKNYPTYKISEAARIVDPAGVISYEAEVEKGREEMDLIFDSNGGFLKKEVESGEKKDDKKKD